MLPASLPVLSVSWNRMGMRQNADMRNVAEFTYRTFSAPIIAMSTPLIAGPNNNPMLFVPWIKAFAVTNSVRTDQARNSRHQGRPKDGRDDRCQEDQDIQAFKREEVESK